MLRLSDYGLRQYVGHEPQMQVALASSNYMMLLSYTAAASFYMHDIDCLPFLHYFIHKKVGLLQNG